MKMFLIFCAFAISTIESNSQTLTITELKQLTSKSLSDCENFLIEKEYEFWRVDKQEDNCSMTWFTFGRNTSALAETFVSLAICNDRKPYTVFYQLHDKKKYLNLKKQAELLGYKKRETKIDNDGTLRHIYTKKNDVVDELQFLSGPSEENSNKIIYTVEIVKFANVN